MTANNWETFFNIKTIITKHYLSNYNPNTAKQKQDKKVKE